jgi:cyclophilin family peptidyl-prolyl cis-trans isomerase/HEAT repeat protein
MLKNFLYLLITTSLVLSCGEKKSETYLNKFCDPVVRKIYQFKDQRLSDSLYQFFRSESPKYRREAALSFASIQDSASVEALGKLLMREPDSTVRSAAALAIGQTPFSGSERILLGALMREKNADVLKHLLEAYGKTTSHWQLIHPSFLNDTIKAEGLSWSIYRAGLKSKTDSAANRIAALLLHEKHHALTQLGAAQFFARSGKNFQAYIEEIAVAAQEDPSVEVRIASTLALGKIGTSAAMDVLEKILNNESDPRVKINVQLALRNFDFNNCKRLLYGSLYNKNVNVGIAASEVIKGSATKESWIELSNLTSRIQQWRIQANLFEAALAKTDNKTIVDEVQTIYRQSTNNFQKAALLNALQFNLPSFDFIANELANSDTAIIRSAAASALAGMHENKSFNVDMKKRFASLAARVMPMGDISVIGTFAGTLAHPDFGYKSIVNDIGFLRKAGETLTLPKDNEALQVVEAAIAHFENREPIAVKNNFNHPIDWDLVQKIPRNQQVIVKTTRGHIKLQMLVEDAPGSVSNFISLARKNYFDNKFFHRVVPNFVVQAGCNRGDGWGGEDYSIRSEFSHVAYKTGSVGMASAGKDTEGTQWFITHSPTPHLDGRYSLFAEVIEGMTVVNLLEVGDQIIDVEVLK